LEELRKVIGKRIRKAREKLHLTQEKLAEEVDVTSSFIGMLERGEKSPSVEVLEKVALALGVSVGHLTSREPEEELKKSSQIKSKLVQKIHQLDSEQVETIAYVAEALGRYKPRPKK